MLLLQASPLLLLLLHRHPPMIRRSSGRGQWRSIAHTLLLLLLRAMRVAFRGARSRGMPKTRRSPAKPLTLLLLMLTLPLLVELAAQMCLCLRVHSQASTAMGLLLLLLLLLLPRHTLAPTLPLLI